MDKTNFPIEFNNEIDDVKKSENEIYTLAVDRLSKLAKGHNDISGAMVNLKQPAKSHFSPGSKGGHSAIQAQMENCTPKLDGLQLSK